MENYLYECLLKWSMLKRVLKLTDEDKEWAKAVKDRDGWACAVCGHKHGETYNGKKCSISAHHLIVRENPETKCDVQNGLSLCSRHHFFHRQISAHNNPIGLIIWLMQHRPKQFEYVMAKQRELLEDYED